MNNKINTLLQPTPEYVKIRKDFYDLFKECPIPENEMLSNLGLFINRQTLSRMLFFDNIYKKILETNGIIIEFGCRWGQNLALFESLRGMYEPYNHYRKIIGFDTFEGFSGVAKQDGDDEIIKEGSYSVTPCYEEYFFSKVLDYHEKESPFSHIKKYQLIKGDATKSINDYLSQNPQTIIAFAYFDFDGPVKNFV